MTISYMKFCYCLLSPQALFSDTGYDDTDQIAKVRREVNEVKGVMTQNIGNGFRLQLSSTHCLGTKLLIVKFR